MMEKKTSKLSPEDFFASYFKDLQYAPFFNKWFEREYLLITKRYDKGLEALITGLKTKKTKKPQTQPRLNKYHAAHIKDKFALLKGFGKFRVKDFAQVFDVKYSVLRVWSVHPDLRMKTVLYIADFVETYIKKIRKRFPPPNAGTEYLKKSKKDDRKLKQLFDEAHYYTSPIQMMIFDRILLELKTDPEHEVVLASTALTLIDRIRGFSVFKPPRGEKNRELFSESIKKRSELNLVMLESLYSQLERFIKTGDTKSALEMVDFLQDNAIDLAKDRTELQISLISKGKKIQKDRQDGANEKFEGTTKKATT